jgi:hypothetical protein
MSHQQAIPIYTNFSLNYIKHKQEYNLYKDNFKKNQKPMLDNLRCIN